MHTIDLLAPALPHRGLDVPSLNAHEVTAAQLRDDIAQSGIAFVNSIDNVSTALRIADLLGEVRQHRDANEDGVTVVAPKRVEAEGNGFLGFGFDALFPHTDRTIAVTPPHLVFVWRERPGDRGEETLLVDGLEVYRELCTSWPDVADQLRVPDAAVFESDGALLRSAIFFEPEDSKDRLGVRFRFDRLMYINCIYSGAIPVLRAIIMAKAIKLRLGSGQGYIVSNTRWLHGRNGFGGERRYLRLLIDTREAPAHRHFGFDAASANAG
ncbi:hypothetical protein ACVIJ6_005977 [Bradyrhizobium sp. USDA 4369]